MENKKELEVDITKITLDVYNKIAVWHNTDFDSNKQKGDALKIISHEVVQTIIDDIFSQLNTATRTEVKRGDTLVGSVDSKDTESFENVIPEDTFSKLFVNKKN